MWTSLTESTLTFVHFSPSEMCGRRLVAMAVGFQIAGPDKSKAWPTYFGVQAGYRGAVCSVSIPPAAIHLGGDALEQLRASVPLHDWQHGGYVCDFQSEEAWADQGNAVL